MDKKVVNIAYALLNEQYYTFQVSLESLIFNNSNCLFKIYLLIDENFNKDFLKNILACKKNDNILDIVIINIESSKYKYVSSLINSSEIYTSSFYRFELIRHIDDDRVLFLSDISLATGDILELYNMDIEKYSCAVSEFVPDCVKLSTRPLSNEFFFSDLVMLINLNWWRRENYIEKIEN